MAAKFKSQMMVELSFTQYTKHLSSAATQYDEQLGDKAVSHATCRQIYAHKMHSSQD